MPTATGADSTWSACCVVTVVSGVSSVVVVLSSDAAVVTALGRTVVEGRRESSEVATRVSAWR